MDRIDLLNSLVEIGKITEEFKSIFKNKLIVKNYKCKFNDDRYIEIGELDISGSIEDIEKLLNILKDRKD